MEIVKFDLFFYFFLHNITKAKLNHCKSKSEDSISSSLDILMEKLYKKYIHGGVSKITDSATVLPVSPFSRVLLVI